MPRIIIKNNLCVFFICCFPSKFKIKHRQHNIPLVKRISICDFLLFATNLPSEMSEMSERFLPFLSIFFCFLIAYSEFFWRKVKRFSEFHFTAKFWSFKLKMPFRMAGEDKNFQPPFFLPKFRIKKRRRKASLHWDLRLNFTSSRGDSRISPTKKDFLVKTLHKTLWQMKHFPFHFYRSFDEKDKKCSIHAIFYRYSWRYPE